MAKPKADKENKDVRRRRQNNTVADWGGIDPRVIAALVTNISRDGGAVRFGYSRDGGAYSLGIYGDGKPFTEFCPATGDVDGWLEGLLIDYE